MKDPLFKAIKKITENWDFIGIFLCIVLFVVFPPFIIAFAIWMFIQIIREMEQDED
jgi:hypothetical protein